jgi:hypothetical protein
VRNQRSGSAQECASRAQRVQPLCGSMRPVSRARTCPGTKNAHAALSVIGYAGREPRGAIVHTLLLFFGA